MTTQRMEKYNFSYTFIDIIFNLPGISLAVWFENVHKFLVSFFTLEKYGFGNVSKILEKMLSMAMVKYCNGNRFFFKC